jgi:hypothetical protein
VTVGRLAKEDVDLHGRCVHAGERVVLPFGAATATRPASPSPTKLQSTGGATGT